MTEDDAKCALQARVSRETWQKLELHAGLLEKWQRTINLVAPSTLPTLWKRHFLDSAQLWDLAPASPKGHWLDLGSGGGFPGLVIAAMAAEMDAQLQMTLVESDKRKCSFLREAARQMNLKVTIHDQRIDNLAPQDANIISARALAPLANLITHASPHLCKGGTMLFPKGAKYQQELASLPPDWHSKIEVRPSETDPQAVILRITP